MKLPIYLDYAATTPVDERVAHCMASYLTRSGVFGNPASASHSFGRHAAAAVEDARAVVAQLINASPQDIIFTSGATESNNLALKGATAGQRRRGKHIVTTQIEHSSVLDPCRWLERNGFEVSYVYPQPDGLVPVAAIANVLRPDTVMISVMHVNNELGTINDVAAIGALARERGILFHTDGAQSAGKIPIDVDALNVDLMSLSAHKIYGPKGIGALYVRGSIQTFVEAQQHGGGHERGLRSGTLAPHQIVGMGEAFRIARLDCVADGERVRKLRDRLWQGLRGVDGATLNGHPEFRVAGILNVSFAGLESETLLAALADIAISSGSACNSARLAPSHVLTALGMGEASAHSALRFSLGRYVTPEEIDYAIDFVRRVVSFLRDSGP